MMQHNCHQLYRPFDVGVFQMDAAIAASCWETGTWMFIDETIGIPSLLATTKSYPNLGTQYPPSAANPQNFNDRAGWLVAQSATGFGGGSGGGFYPARDHSPSPEIMPYLKTGDYVWIESLLVAQSTSSLNVDTTSYTFPNNQNYSFVPWTFINYPFNGNVYGMADTIWGWGRGKAWCCRTMGFGLHITPATRPELPYFRDRHADAAHCALLCTQYIVPSDGQILANYVVQTQDSGNGNTVGATAQWEDDFMFLAFAMEAWKGEYADWLSLMTNYFYRHCPGYLDENPSSNNPLINGSAQPPGVIWPMGSDGNLFIGQGGVFAKTWDDMYALSANYAGPGYGSGHSSTTGTITAGSNVISNIATFPGSNPPSLLFWNAVPTNSGVTPTTFYFPSYSFGGTVSGNSLTLRAYPGTNINPVASGFTGTINVTVIWNGNPIPWPGRADVISRFPDYIDFGYPGGDSAADPTSYHNIATSAVGLASILYSVTGNSVFQNAAAIYNEIRRRQGYMGGLPSNPTGWASAGNNPLTFRNWPKYGIGPIGSPY
jgi:hypothetical protein